MNSPAERDSGKAWFDDRWERSYTIAEVEVTPPDRQRDFEGLDHTLVIQIMGEDGGWTPLVEAPVTPEAARGTGGWEKHHPNQFNPDYFIIRLVKSFEPIAARGIRFELNGAKTMGGGWIFWVRSAPQPAAVGETRYEWRYTHVW